MQWTTTVVLVSVMNGRGLLVDSVSLTFGHGLASGHAGEEKSLPLRARRNLGGLEPVSIPPGEVAKKLRCLNKKNPGSKNEARKLSDDTPVCENCQVTTGRRSTEEVVQVCHPCESPCESPSSSNSDPCESALSPEMRDELLRTFLFRGGQHGDRISDF